MYFNNSQKSTRSMPWIIWKYWRPRLWTMITHISDFYTDTAGSTNMYIWIWYIGTFWLVHEQFRIIYYYTLDNVEIQLSSKHSIVKGSNFRQLRKVRLRRIGEFFFALIEGWNFADLRGESSKLKCVKDQKVYNR